MFFVVDKLGKSKAQYICSGTLNKTHICLRHVHVKLMFYMYGYMCRGAFLLKALDLLVLAKLLACIVFLRLVYASCVSSGGRMSMP